jgi:hypothetical protein
VAVVPNPPTLLQNLNCTANITDNGGFGVYNVTFNWFQNGTNQTAWAGTAIVTNATNALVNSLSYLNVLAGDNYSCSISAANGSANSGWVSSLNDTEPNPILNCTLNTGIHSVVFQPHFTWNSSSGVFSNVSNYVYPVNQTRGTYVCNNTGTGYGFLEANLSGSYPDVVTAASADNFTTVYVLNTSLQIISALNGGSSVNVSFYRNYSTMVLLNRNITLHIT